MELSKQYNPHEIEKKWLKFWLDERVGKSEVSGKKPYCIVIPPPNVTDILHMGHALNNVLQDVLIRYKRMLGFESLWLPGTDHAGIATQNVLEKQLAKDGISRHDIGREKFIDMVWQWKKDKGGTIIQQLQELGCQCDWDRLRFTMDDVLSNAVKEVFLRLYEKGLIYQGEYIVNWCPRCTTAIANLEVEYEDVSSKLWYIKYPIKGEDGYVIVATTRPETMLGDVAVAFNPKDERYSLLKGKKIILPLLNRELDIIYDDYVDRDFGTGAVKVTPAHDINDFDMGTRHKLPFINILNPDGTLNDNAGQYKGLDRFDARRKVIEDLEELGLLEKIEDYKINLGHCYRCDTVVEPLMSRQWFLKMLPLSKPAIDVVKDGRVRFIPDRWSKVYLSWMENIRDWCISRQLWWGHRIPIWYCNDCDEINVSIDEPKECRKCHSTSLRQDEDVLDTWFSSWLWPFSTFGWPSEDGNVKKELEYYYPTDTLITAKEIIFFWVAKMIMAGLEFTGRIPFKEVHIHGTVRDELHRKMSKSLGNGIDPLEIIEEFGADALRYAILACTSQGQDVVMDTRSREAKLENFTVGRNFCNKLYNATRFLLMKCEGTEISIEQCGYAKDEDGETTIYLDGLKGFIDDVRAKGYFHIYDEWILSRLNFAIDEVEKGLATYRYDDAVKAIGQDFFWHDFCDWYIEIAKLRLAKSNDEEEKAFIKQFLTILFENILRVLHPFIPFITEELWHSLPIKDRPCFREGLSTICKVAFPSYNNAFVNKGAEGIWDSIQEITTIIRNLKSEINLQNRSDLPVIIKTQNKAAMITLRENEWIIKELARVSDLRIVEEARIEGIYLADITITGDIEVALLLEGKVDVDKERQRLVKEIERTKVLLFRSEKTLNNKDFLANAKEEVISKQRELKEELSLRLDKLQANLKRFS